MESPNHSQLTEGHFDPEVDRYPTFAEVIRAVQADEDIGDDPVERVEITCLASNEATYKIWRVRAEEPLEGVYSWD